MTAAGQPAEEQEWEPANDTERELVRALTDNDRRRFFQILTTAELYLPQLSTADPSTGQTFVTAELFGQTVLPVYTSVAGMAGQVAGVADAYTTTSYPQLRDRWPRPEWRLAVNPGLPIDAYLPVEAVAAAAAGEVTVATAAEALVDGVTEDGTGSGVLDADQQLRVAATAGDPDGYVDALLEATVRVPTDGELADPEQALFEPRFPWRLAQTGPAPVIEAFTSDETLALAHPQPVPSVVLPFALLLRAWPEGHALSVNPGSDRALQLPPDQVPLLLLWAAEEGGVGGPEPA